MKSLQFVALVLTALALVPGGAHLFALPNKIRESSYFVAQTIYRGWALLGIVLIAALLANVSLAVLTRAQRVPFIFLAIYLRRWRSFSLSPSRPIRLPTTGRKSRPTGNICAGNGKSHTP